jgi:3-hydroxyacyl-CoA dehydrogenase
MALDKPILRIAIVGTGVIGASWAAEFLARGVDVIVTDPAPNAGSNLRKYIDTAWPSPTALGLDKNALRERLSFTPDLKKSLGNEDFVQENRPERKDFKVQLFADMDAATPPHSIIASSLSGLAMSVIQSGGKHPERRLGHPFNPPDMVPLVEVAGGASTSVDAVRGVHSSACEVGRTV